MWVAFFRSHTRQTFVETVDFISARGYGSGPRSNESFGISADRGPKLVITNLAVLDFCPQSKRMRLKSTHPGCTVEQVCDNTGFDLIVPSDVSQTDLPAAAELALLRNEIDAGGLLRNLIA